MIAIKLNIEIIRKNNTLKAMMKIEKRVTDNAEIVIENHRTAIKGMKGLLKGTKNDTEKRKLKDIIASLEKDIESIKSDGIEEFNRKKRILKRLNDLKAQFDALNKD